MEITLLEVEVIPAIQPCLARIDGLDQRLLAQQELPLAWLWLVPMGTQSHSSRSVERCPSWSITPSGRVTLPKWLLASRAGGADERAARQLD